MTRLLCHTLFRHHINYKKIYLKYGRYRFFFVSLHPQKRVFVKLSLKKHLESMAYVIGDDCIACGTCQGECPVEAISEGEKYVIDADLCTECGTCASVCPSEAISLPA